MYGNLNKEKLCAVSKNKQASYSCCDCSMFFSFVIDHPDPGALKHVFHLLWSGCGGKVHILRPLPRQQVTYSTSSYPQFMLVLHKQLWEDKLTGVKQQINGLQDQITALDNSNLVREKPQTLTSKERLFKIRLGQKETTDFASI